MSVCCAKGPGFQSSCVQTFCNIFLFAVIINFFEVINVWLGVKCCKKVKWEELGLGLGIGPVVRVCAIVHSFMRNRTKWRSQKVNQATPSLSHSPVKVPVPVRTCCTNAWRNRCKTDLNSFPRRKLDETTGTSSYYMDENHLAGSEIQRP